jgi:chemotaxis signal transduction protein
MRVWADLESGIWNLTSGAILIAMAQEVPQGRKDRRVLLVRCGGLGLALPADDVVRVVRDVMCHPVPGAQPHFLGLAQYGGEPLPVLDPHALLEGQATGARYRSTVILGRGRRRKHSLVGLAVEEVLRVAEVRDAAASEDDSDLVTEVVRVDGEAVKILNTDRLLGGFSDETGAVNG